MISVICYTFDGKIKKDKIKHLLNQDFNNFELLFIDNGLKKYSIKNLSGFQKDDSRVKIFSYDSKKDFSFMINDCIEKADGEYIYFHNLQFDLVPDAFATLFNLAEEHNLDHLVFNYSKTIWKKSTLKFEMDNDFKIFEGDSIWDSLVSNPWVNGNILIRKSSANNIDFENNFADFFFKVRLNSKKGMILNKSLANITKEKFQDVKDALWDVDEIYSIFDLFYKNKSQFENHKNDLIGYVMQQLKDRHDKLMKYNPSPKKLPLFLDIKRNFTNKLKWLFDKFYFDYKIYDDIKSLNDDDLFSFFEEFLINPGPFRLSVVIPVFNTENYLEDTLNSIVNQTLDSSTIEVIMVDDCSTDSSPEIMRKFSEKYPNFKSFFLENNSNYAGRPRNIALEHVSSNFVSFLDADDYYYEDACENLYYNMIYRDADVVIGSFTSDVGKVIRDNSISYYSKLNQFSVLEFNSIKKSPHLLNSANVWNKIFKLEIIRKYNITFPEGVPAQDTEFLFRFLLKSNRIILISNVVTHYHSARNAAGDQSVTHRRNKLNIYGRLQVYNSMYEASLEENMEQHYIKNLLVNKLCYLLLHVRDTDLSRDEVKELFEEYQGLFNLCIDNNANIKDKFAPIFNNIYDLNIDGIMDDLEVLRSKRTY